METIWLMGTIIQGKCPKCGYHAEIPVGGGLRDCRPETALAAARNDAGLHAALKENGRFRIERFPAVCAVCRRMFAAAQVTYWTADGAEHAVQPACPGCGGPVRRPAEAIPCPVCGHPLDQTSVGHWD